MTIVAGDILRTTANFTLGDGTQYQNVYHHKRTGVGIISDEVHVTTLETWCENMYNEIITYVRSNVVEQLCYVDRIDFVVDEWKVVENIGTFLPAFNPASVGEGLPNQVSPFVVFKTNRPKTVGRKFLFPFDEICQANSIMNSSAVEDVVAYADDAVNTITIQALDYLIPGVPRTGVDDWQEFTLAIVTDLLGTQRRRRLGEGA